LNENKLETKKSFREKKESRDIDEDISFNEDYIPMNQSGMEVNRTKEPTNYLAKMVN
jgi:hypothetical protein